MTAVERLAEIEARERENWPKSEDARTLSAALRAVLALHAPNGMPVNRCTHDRLPYDLCPTVRAIDAALDVTS